MTYTNSKMAFLIDEYIHSARDRDILKDRLFNGLTYSELEDKYHISERQIKRIVKRADALLLKL